MRHVSLLVFSVCVLGVTLPASMAGEPKTEPPFTPLWSGPAPAMKDNDKDAPGVYVYLPRDDRANGAAVVICPGGGYGGLAMSYEGHDVARWLNSLGVAGIVLKYRHAPKYQHPIPLGDAQRAIRQVRMHAKSQKWNLQPDRIGILGFSAGGHLASTAGTHFDLGNPAASDATDAQSCRPDFMILIYPVITMTDPYTHKGSRHNLLGANPDAKLVDELSNEKQVTAKTPPTFLAHTTEDSAVPPQNSVLFYEALVRHNVPAELHIYEKGPHGLGMDRQPKLPFSSWPQRCAAWMDGRGLLSASKSR
jgi:acetyl esterase/lipase